jgi:glutathione S-transferase/RNA polymerase-associated protein
MPLKLFEHPLSPYARKVKIALYEKGIPFERILIEPLRVKPGDPFYDEFAAASPRLEVPCLVDGDFCCFDSTIIVDYIDERWPDPPLLPKPPEERARARIVEDLCDTTLDAILWGLMELRFFRRAAEAQAEQMAGRAGDQLSRVWDRMEEELAGRPWMSGPAFGRADATLIVHVTAASLFGFPPLERHSRLRAWSAQCQSVASVQRDAADLAVYLGGDGMRAMRKAPYNRQYRDLRLEWMMKTGGANLVQKGMEEGTIHFSAWP